MVRRLGQLDRPGPGPYLSNVTGVRTTRKIDAGIFTSLAVLTGVLLLLRSGNAIVATWFYLLAWIPLLVALDLTAIRIGASGFLERPREIPGMLWCSAVIWFVFEAFNFVVRNWYYVNLEPSMLLRWAGTILAFGTVIPAIFVPERILRRLSLRTRLDGFPITIRDAHLRVAFATGWVVIAGILLLPRLLYPFVWGATWLLAEPLLWRRRPDESLWRDMARGHWGRIIRLLLAGLIAGFIWESLNIGARAKWIYTVPFLEQLKLFEMPYLGFLGFPFFALEAWSMYHLATSYRNSHAGYGVTKVVGSVIFVVVVLAGMERWTISSTAPVMDDLARVTSASVVESVREAGYEDVWALARADLATLIRQTRLPPRDATTALEWSRMASLRGIGSVHADRLREAGVTTVGALARSDPAWLAQHFTDEPRPTAAEIRVWVRAAQRAEGADGDRGAK